MTSSKVLLFETDPALRYSRDRLLTKEGYHVTEASSLEEAVEAAKREFFDVLIMNVENPDLLNMLLAQFPPSLFILLLADRKIADKLVENTFGVFCSYLFGPYNTVRFKNAVLQSVSRNRQLRQGIKNEVLTDLGALNQKLTVEPGIDKFMDTIVKIGAVSMRADYVSMLAYGDGTPEPIIKTESGYYNPAWDIVFDRINEISDPVIINYDSEMYSGIIDQMQEAGIVSVMHVPLIIKGNTLGAVTGIKAAGEDQFLDSDLSFMSILAWWTSMAIENTRVYLDYYKEHLYANRLLDHLSSAQENERKRVAIDIHDGVAQWLVGASYDVKLCSRMITDSNYSELGNTLDKVKDVLQKSVKELRRAIANLPPPPLEEMGLVGSVTRMAQKLEEEGIRCLIEIPEELPPLSLSQEKTFYWLIQESLTNIQKHADATLVNIHINCTDDTITICVSDNGVGFEIDKVMKSNLMLEHLGLLGMKERAGYLNGDIDIDSGPGVGTSVTMSFSLLPKEEVTIVRS